MPTFTVCLSHDVDRIYKTYQYISHDLRFLRFSNLESLFTKDNPYWCFEKIMKVEDKYQIRSTFFFIEETIPFRLSHPWEWNLSLGKYRFSNNDIITIMRQLDKNEWEIGLHGSFNSYKDYKLLLAEKKSIENALEKPVYGVRQHYLNLQIPETWKIQKQAKIFYDATYGLKNNARFSDNNFSPFINKESNLLIIPLTLMDGYLFKNNCNLSSIWSKCLKVINIIEEQHAVLSVLWHQRVFNEKEFPGYSEIYEKLIIECKSRGARFLTHKQLFDNKEAYVKN